jgi:hypothetical protein
MAMEATKNTTEKGEGNNEEANTKTYNGRDLRLALIISTAGTFLGRDLCLFFYYLFPFRIPIDVAGIFGTLGEGRKVAGVVVVRDLVEQTNCSGGRGCLISQEREAGHGWYEKT